MAGHRTVIEITEAEIQDYPKEEGEIEQGEISTILCQPYPILHDAVYTKYPEWFDQNISKDEQQ